MILVVRLSSFMRDTHVYLLRHAQSSPSTDVRESEWPLSKSGIQQAHSLVGSLNELDIDKVFSSPFRRAIETVAPYCRSTNTHILLEADLRERKLKEENMEDDWKYLVEKSWQNFDFAVPNCESGFSCQTRIANCISKLVETNIGKRLLVSSHGNAIGLYLNKLDSSFGFSQWSAMKNPDLFKIVFVDGAPQWEKDNELSIASQT